MRGGCAAGRTSCGANVLRGERVTGWMCCVANVLRGAHAAGHTCCEAHVLRGGRATRRTCCGADELQQPTGLVCVRLISIWPGWLVGCPSPPTHATTVGSIVIVHYGLYMPDIEYWYWCWVLCFVVFLFHPRPALSPSHHHHHCCCCRCRCYHCCRCHLRPKTAVAAATWRCVFLSMRPSSAHAP